MSSFMFNCCFLLSSSSHGFYPDQFSLPSIMHLSSPTLPESISLYMLPWRIGILRSPGCSSRGVSGVTITKLCFWQLSVWINCYNWEGGRKGNPEGQSQNLCLKTTQMDDCVVCKTGHTLSAISVSWTTMTFVPMFKFWWNPQQLKIKGTGRYPWRSKPVIAGESGELQMQVLGSPWKQVQDQPGEFSETVSKFKRE